MERAVTLVLRVLVALVDGASSSGAIGLVKLFFVVDASHGTGRFVVWCAGRDSSTGY